jgi:predicted RNase H-like HicB family nuclease
MIHKNCSILIQWSEANQCYVVTLPEFAGSVMQPCSDGATYAEAACHGQEAIESLVELFQEQSKELPQPQILQFINKRET